MVITVAEVAEDPEKQEIGITGSFSEEKGGFGKAPIEWLQEGAGLCEQGILLGGPLLDAAAPEFAFLVADKKSPGDGIPHLGDELQVAEAEADAFDFVLEVVEDDRDEAVPLPGKKPTFAVTFVDVAGDVLAVVAGFEDKFAIVLEYGHLVIGSIRQQENLAAVPGGNFPHLVRDSEGDECLPGGGDEGAVVESVKREAHGSSFCRSGGEGNCSWAGWRGPSSGLTGQERGGCLGWRVVVARTRTARKPEDPVMPDFDDQLTRMRNDAGFIAALDQSGGSTPKALREYGIDEDAYFSEEEMFALVHEMRSRIIRNRAFDAKRILGAILFEATMEREVEGRPTTEYLWREKGIVPFLKVDQGMEPTSEGVQLMKEMTKLDELLGRAKQHGVFGTKMRSVIQEANARGIESLVDQQFEYGRRIIEAGLVPIIEPEVHIHAPDKAEAERMLRDSLLGHLESLGKGEWVIFKLTLPSEPGFYEPCRTHPNLVRVVALSGGYAREEANGMLARNPQIIASFSRALLEGLSAQQDDEAFTQTLDASVESIYRASAT